MGTTKKTVAIVSMLVFMLGGAVAGGYILVLSAPSTLPVTSAMDYVLAFILFCLLMLSGFVGMCLGVLMWMLVLKPFASKQEMQDTFVSDPMNRYPRTTRLLENLLDVIY